MSNSQRTERIQFVA